MEEASNSMIFAATSLLTVGIVAFLALERYVEDGSDR
jgi:hypothetical protein